MAFDPYTEEKKKEKKTRQDKPFVTSS